MAKMVQIRKMVSRALAAARQHKFLAGLGVGGIAVAAFDWIGRIVSGIGMMERWLGPDWIAVIAGSVWFRLIALALGIVCFLRIGHLAARAERDAAEAAAQQARDQEVRETIARQQAQDALSRELAALFNSATELPRLIAQQWLFRERFDNLRYDLVMSVATQYETKLKEYACTEGGVRPPTVKSDLEKLLLAARSTVEHIEGIDPPQLQSPDIDDHGDSSEAPGFSATNNHFFLERHRENIKAIRNFAHVAYHRKKTTRREMVDNLTRLEEEVAKLNNLP